MHTEEFFGVSIKMVVRFGETSFWNASLLCTALCADISNASGVTYSQERCDVLKVIPLIEHPGDQNNDSKLTARPAVHLYSDHNTYDNYTGMATVSILLHPTAAEGAAAPVKPQDNHGTPYMSPTRISNAIHSVWPVKNASDTQLRLLPYVLDFPVFKPVPLVVCHVTSAAGSAVTAWAVHTNRSDDCDAATAGPAGVCKSLWCQRDAQIAMVAGFIGVCALALLCACCLRRGRAVVARNKGPSYGRVTQEDDALDESGLELQEDVNLELSQSRNF